MRLSTILYFMISLLLLSVIGCSSTKEQRANDIFDDALYLIKTGYYPQALERIDFIINDKEYKDTELVLKLTQGSPIIKGYTYKVFKNDIVPSHVAKEEMPLIGRALDIYAEDNSLYPTNEQGLNALIIRPNLLPKPKNWRGPYIKRTDFNDPWGNPYQYKLVLKYTDRYGYDLYSFGSDGKNGGGDDIHR
jgi:type II secretion system protein G